MALDSLLKGFPLQRRRRVQEDFVSQQQRLAGGDGTDDWYRLAPDSLPLLGIFQLRTAMLGLPVGVGCQGGGLECR